MENLINNNFRYWTGDKTPELALFYNIALERLKRFLKKEAGFDLNIAERKRQMEIAVQSYSYDQNIKDKDYLKLKNLLWKGFLDDKNRSGTEVTEEDKKLICALIVKLDQIRNFQSHYYHSNHVLIFNPSLKRFVQDLFDAVRLKTTNDYSTEATWFEESFRKHKAKKSEKKDGSVYGYIFNQHNGEWYLNQEGKGFFLSLFLTTGEMKLFLKQRKGSKRDDGKDFQYKHALYTALCHRDGAARFFYNQDDSFLETNADAAEEILKKRQFYKINTYLNDLPAEIFDTRLFPIPGLEPGKEANLAQLKQILKDKSLLSNWTFFEVKPKAKPGGKFGDQAKTEPLVPPDPRANFKHKLFPDLHFSISRKTLEGLVLACLRGDEALVERAVLDFGNERKALVDYLLTNKQPEDIEPEQIKEWLEAYPNYKIRNNSDKFRFQLSRWIANKGVGKSPEKKLMESLRKKLREEPIELKLLDFFQGENRKPRQKDEFMSFGLRYLVDFKVFPKLNLHWQSFEVVTNREGKKVLTEISCFQPNKPIRRPNASADWRLKLTPDNQILFSWGVATEPIEPGDTKNQNTDLPLFVMGHRVLKNLLIAHFIPKKDKEIEAFFDALTKEVNQIFAGEEPAFELLSDKYLPVSLKKEQREKAKNAFKPRLAKRLKFLIDEYKRLIQNPPATRHARNKVVLDTYLLFDWPTRTNGTELHLRKNEIQWMSIYHFDLHKTRHHFLLDKIKGGNPNRIPSEIEGILKKTKSLDDLYVQVLQLVLEKLQSWCNLLEKVKGSKLKEMARKVGLSLYEGDKPNRRLPFDIHPEMFVKGVFRKEFEKNTDYNVSDFLLKNSQYPKGIRHDYYKLFHLEIPAEVSIWKKRIGALNTLKVKDQILFLIGAQYEPTYIQVEDLFSKEIRFIPLPDAKIKKPDGLFDIKGRKVEIRMKYHQLDDFMVLLTASEAQKLAWHYLVELGILDESDNWGILTEQIKNDSDVIEKSEKGQIILSISLGKLRQTKDKLFSKNLMALKAIMEFEKNTIDSYRQSHKNEGIPMDEAHWISFKGVLGLSGITEANQVSYLNDDIRTVVLHARIPEYWTFDGERFQKNIFGPPFQILKSVKEEKQNYYASQSAHNLKVK